MEFIKYFFRGNPDGYYFVPFTLQHLLILSVLGGGIWGILTKRKRLSDTKMGQILRVVLASGLLLQQMILYLWYGLSGYFTVQEGLPLYNCRFAIICAAIALLTRKRSLQLIACYWGISGSIMALAMPAMDPFAFPHYTNFSFFGGHFLLTWAAFFMLFVDRVVIDVFGMKFMIQFTTLFHLGIYLFDRITVSNYCYLVSAPIAEAFFRHHVPGLIYLLLVITLWNLLMVGFYLTIKSIQRILGQEEDSKYAF